MVVTEIDVINKTVLTCVFLIGMLCGGVICSIVNSINETRKKKLDK